MAGSTRLALLLGSELGGGAAPLETVVLERVLAWAKKAGATFDPASAPGDSAHLRALLDRETLLDRLLSEWDQAGVWVIGRDEPGFPKRLKRRLGASCPAVLFGRGDPATLGRGGIAVIAGAEARRPGDLVAAIGDAGSSVILDDPGSAGTAAAIVIGREGRLASQGLAAGQTVIGLTPPDALGIDRGVDRGGNRVVAEACRYGLADAAVLVGLRRDDPAWPGAVAAISGETLPVWVDGTDSEASSLVRAGARLLPPGPLQPAELTRPRRSPAARRGRAPAPTVMPKPEPVAGFAETQAGFEAAPVRGAHLRLVEDRPRGPATSASTAVAGPTLYEVFESRLAGLLSHAPLGVVRIAEAMALTRPQTEVWLSRAEADGRVRQDPRTGLFSWISA